MYCSHPKMTDTVRTDYCPDCKYEFYYGDAHAAKEEDRISKLINPGRDRRSQSDYSYEDEIREEEEKYHIYSDDEY